MKIVASLNEDLFYYIYFLDNGVLFLTPLLWLAASKVTSKTIIGVYCCKIESLGASCSVVRYC